MKNLILFCCVFVIHTGFVCAQDVQIDPVGEIQDITAPSHNVLLGKFNIIIVPAQSYHLDSCWLVLHGTTPQVIMNLRFNRSDHPEYDPYTFWGSMQSNHFMSLGEIYNFPAIEYDTTSIEFVADIGMNSLPILGSNISVSLQCSGFSLSHEDVVTNTAFGSVISISSINAISEIVEQEISVSGGVSVVYIFNAPLWITDASGRTVVVANEDGVYYLSPGMYLWNKSIEKGIQCGRVFVY